MDHHWDRHDRPVGYRGIGEFGNWGRFLGEIFLVMIRDPIGATLFGLPKNGQLNIKKDQKKPKKLGSLGKTDFQHGKKAVG